MSWRRNEGSDSSYEKYLPRDAYLEITGKYVEPILQTVWDICMGCKQYQPVKVKHNAINRCTCECMNCDDFTDKSLLSEVPKKRGVNGWTT